MCLPTPPSLFSLNNSFLYALIAKLFGYYLKLKVFQNLSPPSDGGMGRRKEHFFSFKKVLF